jgi:DNA replication protein DnaC
MNSDQKISEQLVHLRLPFIRQHYQSLADEAAREQWTHLQYLSRLIEGESQQRHERCIARRIAAARFPVIKTLEHFDWGWPKKINRAQIQNLFRLAFLKDNASVIFVGGVGTGKSHLALALGHAAAQAQYRLKNELKKFLTPKVLVMDELGYLPIDKAGADLLFQIISGRYEKGSTLITTNQPYKKWPKVFNNDSTITAAVLDRLLHHAHTVLIDGKSYRTKDQVDLRWEPASPMTRRFLTEIAQGPTPFLHRHF